MTFLLKIFSAFATDVILGAGKRGLAWWQAVVKLANAKSGSAVAREKQETSETKEERDAAADDVADRF